MELQATAPERQPATPPGLSVPYGRIELDATCGRCVVRFTGEIDIAFSRDRFRDLVAAVRVTGLTVDVDCSGVTFFSAEGIRMLLELKSAAVDDRLARLVTSAALDRLGRAYPWEALLLAA